MCFDKITVLKVLHCTNFKSENFSLKFWLNGSVVIGVNIFISHALLRMHIIGGQSNPHQPLTSNDMYCTVQGIRPHFPHFPPDDN